MSKSGKYGNRNLSKMLTEWRELRSSISIGDMEKAEYWADNCENWIEEMKTLEEMNDQERLEIVQSLIDGRLEYFNGDDWNEALCLISSVRYRVKPKPLEPLQIPWDVIDDRFKWAAADLDGLIWTYEDEPNTYNAQWQNNGDFERIDQILKSVKRGTIPWDQSLIKRPD